jgi:hypothetical protein
MDKNSFDQLSPEAQWEWALENKERILVTLDNDSTDITFPDDESEDPQVWYLKADVGNRWGIEILLPLIGIKAESV